MPRYVRFALSLALTLLMAGVSSCTKEAEKPTAQESTPAKVLASGTIDLAETAKAQADPLAILFVIARNERGQIAAVKKLFPPFQYPLVFSLTETDSMIPGTELSGKLMLTARLDKDGNANPAQPGDILGKGNPEGYELGAKDVKIVLNEIIQP